MTKWRGIPAIPAAETSLYSLLSAIKENLENVINEVDGAAFSGKSASIKISLQNVSATMDGLSASITNEGIVRASADEALAEQIQQLIVSGSSAVMTYAQSSPPSTPNIGDIWFDTNDNNKVYRYSGTDWVAVDDLRTVANTAAISNEQSARINGDNALASSITSLTALVNTQDSTLQANITSEAAARASADGALATQINTVSTTVNGNTASINTLTTSVNGLQARYGVSLNVNGYVTGFVQNNDGASGSFTILADRFSVVSPSGGSTVTPFTVTASGVQINGNLIVNGSVSTGSLASGAVTASTVYTNDAGLTASTSWQSVANVSITAVDGSVAKVDFSARLTGVADTVSIPAQYRLKRGSTVIRTGTFTVFQSKQVYTDYVSYNTYEFFQPVDSVFSMFHLDTPGAGSFTYTLEVLATTAVTVSERQMLVTELRR